MHTVLASRFMRVCRSADVCAPLHTCSKIIASVAPGGDAHNVSRTFRYLCAFLWRERRAPEMPRGSSLYLSGGRARGQWRSENVKIKNPVRCTTRRSFKRILTIFRIRCFFYGFSAQWFWLNVD